MADIQIQEFIDAIAASVAIVGRTEDGTLAISACNEDFFTMTGGRPPGVDDFPIAFDTLFPSYARHEVRKKLLECLDTRIAQELEQAYDMRDGTHWWRLWFAPFLHTDKGKPVQDVIMRSLEITQRMNLLHELEVTSSRFRSVVDAAYDAIITIDQEHNVTLFNRAAEDLFGYDSSEVLGKPILQLVPETFRQHHSEYIHQFARSPVRSRQMNERNLIHGRHRDGRLLPVEIAISKINVGGLMEFTAIIRDIEDRVRLMNLLQKEATTDQLTGLPNRRVFLDVVGNILKSQENLAVFMLDIDLFKKVNDTYGHDAGDEVLRVLSKVGAGCCRKMDVFARWGGEEFVMALPAADLEQARGVADGLRAKFEKQDFAHDWRSNNGHPIPFTVSVGVATRAPGERDLDIIMKRADEALYKAKGSGRNRVEVEPLPSSQNEAQPARTQ